MQFLVDRGIHITIRDYRWNGTAQGWAFHAAKDEKMAQPQRHTETVADASPVASNTSEEGRAKNRRVELVENQ
jgi:hypothetical protein